MLLIKSTKNMKKIIYALILLLFVVSGLVFSFAPFAYGSGANGEIKNETFKKSIPKPPTAAESKAAMKKWEASSDGIMFKNWKVSPEGKKVQASYDKIKKSLDAFTNMEAVVTSVTFQRPNAKSSGPKWLIVSINSEDYMMQFIPKEFQKLNSLKVNDKIIVRSRSAGLSPNHPYLILSSDYIERNNKILFKRDLSKNKNC